MNQNEKREKSFLSKLSYGMADIYGGGAFVVISTFFTVFMTDANGIPAALAGTIPLIGKVWDAITDPIMGNIADRTSSKFGAKRFYILVGSIISAITFLLMWVVAPMQSIGAKYAFYAVMYMLFSTGFTIVMVPYNALLPDMVDDYTVRSKFSAIRIICSTFGAILAGLIPTLMIKESNDAGAYFRVALIFSVLFFAVILITFFGTWEKKKEPIKTTAKETFVQSFTVYKSRAFRLFIFIFLCGQGAADFFTGVAVYYVKETLDRYRDGNFTLLMAVLLISQFVGTIGLGPVMSKTNKKFPIMAIFPLRIAATVALLFFSNTTSNFNIILALAFIIGIGMAASSTSIYAILSDMADIDELITSISRPSVCSAMATFVRKIVGGCSAAVIGVLLALVGYNEQLATAGQHQPASVQAGIGYIFVFAPLVLTVLTYIFTIMFPVNKKEFDVVRTEIARRKGEDSSKATAEEIAICEKVTGFAYDKLWDRNNALKFSNK